MNKDNDAENIQLRRLLSQARIGWWEANLTQKEYKYSNELAELLGFSNTMISFKEFHALIPETDRKSLLNNLNALSETKSFEQKFSLNTPTQGFVWVNLHLNITPDENHEYLANGFLQLLNEKPIQDSLINIPSISTHEIHLSNDKLMSYIYDKLPIGLELYDPNGFLLEINKRDLIIFGLESKEKVLGVNLFENPNLPPEVTKSLKKGKDINFRIKYNFSLLKEYSSTSLSGFKEITIRATVIKDSQKQILAYLLIVIDNSDRELVLTKIRDFENVFKMISEYAKVGYAKLNPITKTGYAVDQWFKNYGEYDTNDLREIVGTYSKVHPDDRGKILEFYKGVLDGTQSAFRGEIRIQQPDGSWRWTRNNIMVSCYKPKSDAVELIGVNYDISELKEIENELLLAKNKAETMDRLKSAFLANMSHEIRTPLNAIVGFSRLLQEDLPESDKAHYMEIVEENNELLLQLISDILDLSKIEAGTFEFINGDVDIDQLCEDIVQGMQIKVPKHIELVFDDHHSQCHLISDKNRLHQIISNFINNALKFTYKGSIHVGYIEKEHELEFYVEDTGTGISQDKLSSIFERFVKLNSLAQGTGLGLSICKSIVEQFGGQIGVESEEGIGSRFWFTHPYDPNINILPQEDMLLTEQPIVNLVVSSKQKPVILIAEDTDSNYLLISTILKKEYELHRANNGVEAVEKCKTLKPDVILMDIRMPLLDGIGATKEIRQFNHLVPILAVTAFAFDKDKQYALEAGCNAFITKPISTIELKGALHKWLLNK